MAKGHSAKRSIRNRGKKSVSLAMQNETLINKIQENFNEFKKSTEAQLQTLNGTITNQKEGIERSLRDIQDISAQI